MSKMCKDIALDQKLDSTLNSIVVLTKKVDNFDSNLSALDTLYKIESTLSNKINKIENQLQEKSRQKRIRRATLKITACSVKLKKNQEASAVIILIHGIQESPVNAWERPDETLAHVYDFMKAGLQIKHPSEIALAVCYRLPQSPMFNNQIEKLTRPVIIKLVNAMGKRRIFRNLHNLKP